MELLLNRGLALLIVAVLVALGARLIRLPYTVGLVAVGMALALTRPVGGIALTHEFVFDFLLPPLLFEAAINIRWRELRRDLLPVLVLAVPGTLIAAATVSLAVRAMLGWPMAPAVMFGILIAATDPVAVIAMFKDNGIGGRLRLLVESESLFNDGAAAVLFALALLWVQSGGAGITPWRAAETFLLTVGGGILTGALCAGLALGVAGRTDDHLLVSTITTITAYGTFQLAQHLQCSGVLAIITAGLLIGNIGVLADEARGRLTTQGREFILALWEFIAFLVNSVIFLLIGIAVARIHFSDLGSTAMLAVVLAVLLARAVSVYPLCVLFKPSGRRITLAEQHALWWGGLRGALAMALALALPDSFPFKNPILIATFGMVAFSVIIQGVTMPLLLRWLGFSPGKAKA